MHLGTLLLCPFSPWFQVTAFESTWNLNIITIFTLNSFCICILVAYRQSIFNMHVVLTVHTETTRANHLDLSVHQGSRRKRLRVNSVLFTAGNRTFLCDPPCSLLMICCDLLEAGLHTISPGLLMSNTNQTQWRIWLRIRQNQCSCWKFHKQLKMGLFDTWF